ncbi:hypothetical protein SROCM77S_01142 [Streptomyces rochei]
MAAEADFDPYEHGLTPQEVRRLDRAAQFAVVASRGAVADSGLDIPSLDPHRVGVTVGSAVGATMGLDQEYRVVSDGGRLDTVDHTYAVPHLYDYMVPSSFAAEVAWAVGAEGPSTVVSTGCTSGIDSVGYAVELVREGSADVVIAGSSDAPISPITMACFDAIKATTPRHDEPECASRPFDKTRNGFVLGEGTAFFVLEDELDSARKRGAHIYAEIAGYATRSNAYHMTGLRPDGVEMAEAIDLALGEARLTRSPSTTSTPTARAPSRTTGTRRPRSSAASATTPTAPRSAPSSRWSGTRSARSAPSRSPPRHSPWSTTSSRPPPTCTPPTPSATSTTCPWSPATS